MAAGLARRSGPLTDNNEEYEDALMKLFAPRFFFEPPSDGFIDGIYPGKEEHPRGG